eukprot:IDg3374t1
MNPSTVAVTVLFAIVAVSSPSAMPILIARKSATETSSRFSDTSIKILLPLSYVPAILPTKSMPESSAPTGPEFEEDDDDDVEEFDCKTCKRENRKCSPQCPPF